MSDFDKYDADYFLRGKQTGKSLYENYRWLPDLTVPMAKTIAAHLGLAKQDDVLDFGCARGYLVRALRQIGYRAFGLDISQWAIDNADEKAAPYVRRGDTSNLCHPDWVIAKDVLEHICYVERAIDAIMRAANKGVFAVVPLSSYDSAQYVVEDYERDVTHCQRWALPAWVRMFLRPGWRVEASYRLPGVKDNYYKPGWEKANGFITARRV